MPDVISYHLPANTPVEIGALIRGFMAEMDAAVDGNAYWLPLEIYQRYRAALHAAVNLEYLDTVYVSMSEADDGNE